MFTFKAQAKSNAKRFLVKTSGIAESNLGAYLVEHGGQWGTWIDAEGKPVPFESVPVAEAFDPAAQAATPAEATLHVGPTPTGVGPLATKIAEAFQATDAAAAVVEEEPAEPMPSGAGAFGAFAMAQLTAPSNTAAPADAPRAAREGATPTAGLKIQKDRPEQNGMRRQSAGSVGDRLWALYDKAGPDVTLEQAKALAAGAGLSTTSAAIALYNWRKFNGIVTARAAK